MSTGILVIDDDPFTREALVEILHRAGYQVTPLERGITEVEAGLGLKRYQVAVVDYHLPDTDGLKVAQRLKELQPECRVLLISSELPHQEAISGPGAVVDYFLAKPFSKDAILEVIGQLCSPAAP